MWQKVRALLAGEVPADTLEAYRAAGLPVYRLLKQVDDRRLACAIEGRDVWSLAPAEQVEALCAWNAFLLQTLGDAFLEADARADPATIGYVPPATAQQALACYSQVEGWLSRAAQAGSNPGYQLDIAVPADLPAWQRIEPCPDPHMEALLAAARAAQKHAAAALAAFEQAGVPANQQDRAQRLRQLLAEATTRADYAERLWTGRPPRSLRPQIERDLKEAVERFYHLGQLLALPRLVDQEVAARPEVPGAARAGSAAAVARLPGPGEPGFDPWCVTDPATRSRWQRDPAAQQSIALLWRHDPDPRRTLAIQAEIEAALARGDIAEATTRSGERVGHYYCGPWGPIYVVRRPVMLGDQQLRALQQFTYHPCADGVLAGEPFRREILVGPFSSTDEVMYCDPQRRGRHAGAM